MKVIFALLLTVVGWSSSFIFIRLGLESYSAIVVTLGRYLIASIAAAFIYTYIPAKTKLSILDRAKAIGCGVIGMGIYSFSVGLGEETVPASITGFIVGLMPLCSSVLAAYLYKESLSKRLIIGLSLSLVGLLIIAFSGHEQTSFGMGIFWLLLAMSCATAYTIIQKPVLKKMTTPEFICHAIWGGGLVLLCMYLCSSDSFIYQLQSAKLSATLSILYQGIVPSVISFFGWSYALSKTNIAKAALALYTMPLVTAFLAYVFLQEKPTFIALSGMLLAFSGSLLGSLKWPKLRKKSKKSVQATTLQ